MLLFEISMISVGSLQISGFFQKHRQG